MRRGFAVWLLIALFTAAPPDAGAQTCPPNAHVDSVEDHGDVKRIVCKCNAGFQKQGNACVRANVAPPADRPRVSDEWRQREEAWTRLLNMRPSEAGLNVHRKRRNRRRVAFQVQRIANAVGRTVNLDVYAVEIAHLPPGMTPASLLDHVRRNLGDFLDPGLGTFSPFGADDRVDWHASGVAPIGSLSIFGVPVWGPVHEQMGVVTSAASSTQWIFSPVRIGSHSPGMHPVSGNREFGVRSMPDGTVQLYTRAADRVAVRVPGENTIFGGGDSLWRSFQDRVRRFVESRGGRARVSKPEFQRPTWEQIQRSGRLRP